MNSHQTQPSHSFDELTIGQSDQLTRTLTSDDIHAFAQVSGDHNPAHLDADYAAGTPFKHVIGHGMWTASLISCLLGTQLPGLGTIYLSQNLSFRRPVYVGDALTVTATVKEKIAEKKHVVLECLVTNQHGDTVLKGDAKVLAPA